MALLEDATIFLQDFGVPVNSGLVTGLGILDMPGEVANAPRSSNTAARKPVSSASSRAAADLPAPAGPSIATIRGRAATR